MDWVVRSGRHSFNNHAASSSPESLTMGQFTKAVALAGAKSFAAATAPQGSDAKPTIVLVHGAFGESASWNGVIAALNRAGYLAVAAADPVRSVSGEADLVVGTVSRLMGGAR
jgi:predicted alpha/beta-fold hydrolase